LNKDESSPENENKLKSWLRKEDTTKYEEDKLIIIFSRAENRKKINIVEGYIIISIFVYLIIILTLLNAQLNKYFVAKKT
jgi:hypothetical protein